MSLVCCLCGKMVENETDAELHLIEDHPYLIIDLIDKYFSEVIE